MKLSYEDAMKLIHNAEKAGSIMGVDTMRELMNHLGNPQDKLKVIHIAGTNGKGSTLAMLSTILTTGIKSDGISHQPLSHISNGYRLMVNIFQKMLLPVSWESLRMQLRL